jgi:hypothetical protein
MPVRECDAIGYLRLKQKMAPSDCYAILKDGSKLEVFMYRDRPVVEIDHQFYDAPAIRGFARYEKKPLSQAIPEPPAGQLVNEGESKEEPIDTSGQRLRFQLLRNSDAIYKRNIIRQVFGSLEVKEFLGVGQNDSTTRYWSCFCKARGRTIVATQADLVTGVVTCCSNARQLKEQIVFRGALLP